MKTFNGFHGARKELFGPKGMRSSIVSFTCLFSRAGLNELQLSARYGKAHAGCGWLFHCDVPVDVAQ